MGYASSTSATSSGRRSMPCKGSLKLRDAELLQLLYGDRRAVSATARIVVDALHARLGLDRNLAGGGNSPGSGTTRNRQRLRSVRCEVAAFAGPLSQSEWARVVRTERHGGDGAGDGGLDRRFFGYGDRAKEEWLRG